MTIEAVDPAAVTVAPAVASPEAGPADGGRPLRIAMIGLRGIPATHGGVEHAVEGLCLELAARGHDVTVYARTAYADDRPSHFRDVRLRYLPQINTKHLEAITHSLLSVLDAVRSRRYDVVHLHATGPGILSFIPRLAGQPTVATVHGLDYARDKWGKLASRVLRLGLRMSATVPNRTIVVSQELEREVRERFGTDPVYSPNGIDMGKFVETEPVPGLEAGRFLLFLGRLVPEKGVHTLLQAYADTASDLPLVIAGGGTHTDGYVAELEQLAALDPRVRMLGPVYGAQKAWLMRNARLAVLPSTLEGLPIVLLEACACERHCVVSDLPQHLEVVAADGVPNATVFRAGDAASLTQAIEQALVDPDGAAYGPAVSASVLERYRWESIADTTEAVYRQAIARSRRGGARVAGGRPAAQGA